MLLYCADDCVSKSFILTDLESDAKFDISLRFHKWVFNEAKTSTIHMFLAWISRVRDMTICAQTFKVYICQCKFWTFTFFLSCESF